ncbi:MAG: NAD(P)H-dependent oxidoreductase [Candidatus Microsaccharimonas sp.]
MTKIAVLVGSLRADSINQRLAKEVEALLPEGTTFAYADLNLPLYNQDLEADYPAEAKALKELVESADGVLFVTPEHNRSFPAALKNAIDWASRPWGTNSFDGKPAAIIGASNSLATTQAQQQLRNVALYLNTHLLGQPEMYIDVLRVHDEEGKLTPEATELYQKFIAAFTAHIAKLA